MAQEYFSHLYKNELSHYRTKQYLTPIPLSVGFSLRLVLIQPPSLAASVLVEAKAKFYIKQFIVITIFMEVL